MKNSIKFMLAIFCWVFFAGYGLSISVADAGEPSTVTINEATIKGIVTLVEWVMPWGGSGVSGDLSALSVSSTTDSKLKAVNIELYDFHFSPDAPVAFLEIESLVLTYDDTVFFQGGGFQFEKVDNVWKSVADNVYFQGVSGSLIVIDKLTIELTEN